MSFTIFELSLRDKISQTDLETFLSRDLGLRRPIRTFMDFWLSDADMNQHTVGLEVTWGDQGFRTFCRWCQEEEMTWRDFLGLAIRASRTFGTDVVIANGFDPPDGSCEQFLLVTVEAKVFRAYSSENTDIFEIELVDGLELPFEAI